MFSGAIPLSGGPTVAGDGLVSARDGDTVTVSSADSGTMRTVATDCRAPVLSAVSVDEVTETSGRIKWVTDELSDGLATWGEDEGYNATVELAHQVYALDLEPCTEYEIESTDALGNVGRRARATSFITEGDRSVVPASAPEGADPCDPRTWSEEEESPTPPIQQVVNPGDGDGCESCSVGGPRGRVGALALLGLLVARRRRARRL